ncbi:Dabb family protein [Croceivirga sp. JEA036]|uniref:Dabb family protein n=1 Tax=Croceivirga sp. JEA036 TaxID=2721162 RepID=UPI00143B3D59|nr:Dabb family protein [Croceivirga sp. JEA036]NJB36315.1 Dabb family protein [Croceivirga sp. JEA036]
MKKLVLPLLLIFSVTIALAQKKETMQEFDSHFAHVVYFWFKEPDNTADKAKFEASLKKFMASSKYAKTQYIGTAPKAVRDVVDDSFTYNLIATFASAEDQQKYQEEAAHLVFIEECKHMWEKVIVYDSNGIN